MKNKKQNKITNMKKGIWLIAFTMLFLPAFRLPVMAEPVVYEKQSFNEGAVLFEDEPVEVYDVSESASTLSELPERVDLSTSKYFPPIREQQGNSCAAWATTYYQFTYEVAKLNNWDVKHDDSKVFSPKYVWNYLNQGEDGGIAFEWVYDLLKTQGSLRWSEFPQNNLSFEWYTGANETETSNALRRALKTRICEYDKPGFADIKEQTPITGNKDSQLTLMKKLLNEGKVLCMATDCNVETTKNNKVLSNGEKGIISGEASDGGHALTIVGYDDTIYYDLNQNGTIEDFEKGAFLIANSWGANHATHNNGYIWVMYDALNRVSNAANLNTSDRRNFIRLYQIWYMTVKNYTPKRIVEVTVEQKYRDEISVCLSANNKLGDPIYHNNTFLNYIGGKKNFDGNNKNDAYQTRMFAFDYDAVVGSTQVDWENKICWVIVMDKKTGTNAQEDGITKVKKIRWIDESGKVLKTINQQTSIDNDCSMFYYGIPAKSISLNKTSSTLFKGQKEQLTATVLPANATDKSVKWTSSNTSVVRVDGNGFVTCVGTGEAVVTATTKDGSNRSVTCRYSITDDYPDEYNGAYNVSMHSRTLGTINMPNDEDFFAFTPTVTGDYFIYATGAVDTVGYLYDASHKLLVENDDAFVCEANFAFHYSLEANKVYYIRITGYDETDMGDYELNISKTFYGASLASNNQDARRVQMQAEAATVLTSLKLKIGNKTYTLNRPDEGILDTTIDGARFKVTFVENNSGLSTIWVIEARIPATVSGTDTISFDFSMGNITNVKSPEFTGLIAYDSAIKTGVEVGAANSLQRLLDTMKETGYTLEVRNFDNTLVNVTSTTKAATGMKIIKTNAARQIVAVHYVVVFGDVAGGTVNPGSGTITADDALEVQRDIVGTASLVAAVALAADTDHNGDVTAEDSLLILKSTVGSGTIDQDYVITYVPDECYYLDPVIF